MLNYVRLFLAMFILVFGVKFAFDLMQSDTVNTMQQRNAQLEQLLK